VINKTNVVFTADELTLLNKGLKYNLSLKQKEWINTLALTAETAVTLTKPCTVQEYTRIQLPHNKNNFTNNIIEPKTTKATTRNRSSAFSIILKRN
jgi:hypothetical protein